MGYHSIERSSRSHEYCEGIVDPGVLKHPETEFLTILSRRTGFGNDPLAKSRDAGLI